MPSLTLPQAKLSNMTLSKLPFDILHELAGFLEFKTDLVWLALSNRHLFFGLCPIIYSDVQLLSIEQCLATLTMLNNRPDIARHVQKLLIRFSTAPGENPIGYIVSSLVQRLAHTLDALHTFIWDADQVPQRDDLWFVLRTSCPRLKTIGISYGAELPETHSHVFQFKSLRGFTLNVKRGFYERFADADLQEFPAEPHLWDMLVRRSPDLEELHISGAPFISTQIIHPLCYAHWPKLHTLSLGDILLDWNPRPGIKPPFVAFLEAHPQLRSLRISRAALNPAHLTSLEPGSLPELTRFSGAIEHLQALAPIRHQISSVALDEPFVIRDVSPSLLASVLRGLKSLIELRICFVFQSAYEGGSLVRSIAHACPGLTKLEVVCTRNSSLTVDKLAKAVRSLPRLQHLRVTLVRSQHEDPLTACAGTIAHTFPRLHAFSITFIPPDIPLHFDLEIGRTVGHPGHPYIETGNYVIQTDEYDLPISVACTECRSPTSLLSSLDPLLMTSTLSFSNRSPAKVKKQYSLDLRPRARKQCGLGLVLEKSNAGEEVRVFAVLMSLTGLALWGFFS